jgi:hypothetical protein
MNLEKSIETVREDLELVTIAEGRRWVLEWNEGEKKQRALGGIERSRLARSWLG